MDSVFSPNSPLNNYGFLHELFPNWDQLYTLDPLSLPHLEESSIDDVSSHGISCLYEESINNESSLSMGEKQGTQSFSSMADKAESGEQVTQLCAPNHKKRQSRNGSSSNSANYKDAKNTKGKKQKGDKEGKKEDRKENAKVEVEVEAPKGYIHVRARRGQATDSHSLAERARREKISEKMKMLQGLVPGCNKVSGKALMLDEIINYVQSLQTQVEFLSARLASLDPMFFNFGLMEHLDPIMPFPNQEFMNDNNDSMVPMASTEIAAAITTTNSSVTSEPVNFINVNTMRRSTSLTNVDTAKPRSFTTNAIVTTTTIDPTAFDNFHVIDSSTNLLQLGQNPSVLPKQDDRILNWGSGMEDQNRLAFFNQFNFGATNW